jgi:hypothetical protein
MPFLFAISAPIPSVRADDGIPNLYRLTLSTHHPIKGDLTGFAELDYRNNPDKDYSGYEVIWPGLTYSMKHWLQFSGGLLTRFTDNGRSADRLELRPFAGVKLFVPNRISWNIYNYTRYEYRSTQDLDTHSWTAYSRLRSRFGVEFPFTSGENAWQPRTWYGLADVEPIYRFDHGTIDPLNVRCGLGYVLNDRVRMEFIYTAQFARTNADALDYADNVFQLNIKVGLAAGLLRRLNNRRAGD